MTVKVYPTTAELHGEHLKQDEKNWFQVLAIFLASLSTFTGAMLFSWPSPSIPKIVEDKINYNISLEEASYFAVIPPIGATLASFVFAKLTYTIGPKCTVLLVIVPQITSCVLISVTQSLYVLYLARFISGIAEACVFAVVPTYIGEVASPKVRGTWGNLMSFFIYFGQFSINVIGSYNSVVNTIYICMIFPVLFFCTFIFMPESPYFYLMKGKLDHARGSLQKLRRKQNVEEELENLKSDVNRQMSESGTWKDVFTIQSNRKALFAGVFLRTSQQCSGYACFSVYGQYIFLKSGGNISASTSAMIFTGLCVVLNLCAAFTLDKLGRRNSYVISLLFCGVALACEAIYFFIEQFYSEEINVSLFNWIPLAGMIVYCIFYSFGIGIVPTLMLGELFSASIKRKALVLLNIVFALLVSVITKLFQLLDGAFGLYAPFLFFSLSCFVSLVLSFYYVPETKGKTLEEIQQSLKGSTKNEICKKF